MSLRSRIERLSKIADPVVVTLRRMGRRAFTRSELADYTAETALEGAHPLRRLIADAYYEAAFRGITDAELEVYARDDGPELPFREDMAEAGERAVRDLDAAIARGKYPGLAEDARRGTAPGRIADEPEASH